MLGVYLVVKDKNGDVMSLNLYNMLKNSKENTLLKVQ